MEKYEILVQFGDGIPTEEQGPVLLAMEKALREKGIPAEVFKGTREDDSRLRTKLSDLQLRKRL